MKSKSTTSPAPPTDRRRWLGAALGSALLTALPRAHGQGRGMTAIAPLRPAAPLRLPNDDGKLVDIAEYRGRVVLVNFWATWCPPCRKEFPSLGRVRKLFAPHEFEVVAVNVGEEPETAFSFTGNTDFPVVFDRDSKTMAAWSVRGLPTTFLVDRQGRPAFRATGGREFDDADVVAVIRQLLATTA